MNRDEEIGMRVVRAHGPLEKPAPRRGGSDQLDGLVEARVHQRLLDRVRKLHVERIFRRTAGAERAGHGRRMADIEDHPVG